MFAYHVLQWCFAKDVRVLLHKLMTFSGILNHNFAAVVACNRQKEFRTKTQIINILSKIKMKSSVEWQDEKKAGINKYVFHNVSERIPSFAMYRFLLNTGITKLGIFMIKNVSISYIPHPFKGCFYMVHTPCLTYLKYIFIPFACYLILHTCSFLK